MALKWIVPVAAFVALGAVIMPAQAAPLGVAAGTGVEPGVAQQAHYYRHHRHHRSYGYYAPRIYLHSGHRHHRHWRHRR